jgi:hypothetical protein
MQTVVRRVTSLSNCCSAALAAGVIALAMMSIAAPAATADPKNPKPAPMSESTIKKQCEDPDLGGTYGSTTTGGVRVSTCDYLDGDGKYCSDQYKNGVFQNTACGRVAAPVDPRQPLPPGGGSVSGQ